MGTRILTDIHNDIKQLITAITSYEEDEEGFKVCEKYCLSSIKHHRYLSVAANTTKDAVKALISKFSIHGNYEVAKKFEELVDIFLSSFDFEQHPQYDLQWCLLTLLLELSKETHKSTLECLTLTRGDLTFNTTIGVKNDITEEIDWAEYLKEGQDEFFSDYKSETESEWSDDEVDAVDTDNHYEALEEQQTENKVVLIETPSNKLDKLSQALTEELESRKWLLTNVQNTWWNELNWRKYSTESKFCDAKLCELWHKAKGYNLYSLGTLSEYQVCRELLWMFHIQTRMAIFQNSIGSTFSIRQNVSIPSLTIASFNSILSPFCEIFSMMHCIDKFGIELYSRSITMKQPPLTYEAYYAAIQQQLNKIKTELISLEKNIMRQDNCNTLLSVSQLLQKHLKTIKILYEVHESAISDWRCKANWICATKLLSAIYLEMQKSYNQKKANICADLYLSTLTVYLNIIDTWLSEGRLEDWRDEFIIVRQPTNENPLCTEQYEVFAIRHLDGLCIEDPIMQFLIKKVQHVGQSVELLVSLDRITDIWKVNTKQNIGTRTSLVCELFQKLEAEVLKYYASERSGIISTFISEVDGIEEIAYDHDIEAKVIEQLSEYDNPFLTKALEQYIPSNLMKRDIVDNSSIKMQVNQMMTCTIFQKLEEVNYIPPFRKVLETSLSEILHCRYNSASKLVKDIMMKEYKLELHLMLMRSVFMMEAGHIMSKFCQTLFQEIESNQMWSNSYFLSCILWEVLSQQWPDFSSRWSVIVQDSVTHQVMSAVENISLHYAAGWPMNIMLNDRTFERYNEIFRFQLKLKWALWTLNNLRFSDLEDPKRVCQRNKLEQFQIRRLESLRFWLLHAVGSIHAYLSGQVLQNLGFVFEKTLKEADSLDSIISVHNEYLRKVHEHCLLTKDFEDLMVTISNLISMCNDIRKRWTYKNIMFSTAELDVFESNYIKYHTYLALALHNAVQNKDANYCKSEIVLIALHDAFRSKIPHFAKVHVLDE